MAQGGLKIGNRIAPPRFLLFLVVTALASAFSSARWGWRHGPLVGFDVGAMLFLVSLLPLLRHCSPDEMRRHSAENDANRPLLIAIAATVMLVILAVIGIELAQTHPSPSVVAFIISSLAICWLFTNTVYALHYAHMYYQGEQERGGIGGIDFPGSPEPNYWDFIYFSFTLGMTFQTSDSNITATRFRRIVTLHCTVAYIFSIGIIAFTINVLGGVGGSAAH